jgi:hypothetical protein
VPASREADTPWAAPTDLVDNDIFYQGMLAAARSNVRLAETAREGVRILGPGNPAAARLENIARFVDFVGESRIRSAEQARALRHPRTSPTPGDADPPRG